MQIRRNKNGNLTPFSLCLSFQQFDAFCKAEITFFIGRAFINVSKFRCFLHMFYHITTMSTSFLYCKLQMMREELRLVFWLRSSFLYMHAAFYMIARNQCRRGVNFFHSEEDLLNYASLCTHSWCTHNFIIKNRTQFTFFHPAKCKRSLFTVCEWTFGRWGMQFVLMAGLRPHLYRYVCTLPYSQVPKQFALKRILIVCC